MLLPVPALGCTILASLLRERKARIPAAVARLIQKAEAAVRGSWLGETKKALVIPRLEAMNITVTQWLSDKIDEIVALLNEKKAWLTEFAAYSLPTDEDTRRRTPKTKRDLQRLTTLI